MPILLLLPVAACMMLGAIFGFFYTWSFSVMPGFAAADPATAAAAMQAVNATIRNIPFGLIFFGTPLVGALAAGVAAASGRRAAAGWLGAATLVYLAGCIAVTFRVNVPMNEAFALVDAGAADAAGWAAYAGPWTAWNHLRTAASGTALALGLVGLWRIRA